MTLLTVGDGRGLPDIETAALALATAVALNNAVLTIVTGAVPLETPLGEAVNAKLGEAVRAGVCLALPDGATVGAALALPLAVGALALGSSEALNKPDAEAVSDAALESSGERDGEREGDTVRAGLAEALRDGSADGVGITKTMGTAADTVAGVLPDQMAWPVFATSSSTSTPATRARKPGRGRSVIFATGAEPATEKTIQLSASPGLVAQPSTLVPLLPSVHALQRVVTVNAVLAVHG